MLHTRPLGVSVLAALAGRFSTDDGGQVRPERMIRRGMKPQAVALLVSLVALLAACSGPSVQLTPPSGAPYSISVDCGPIPAELSECIALVAAAAKIIPAPPGSRAAISTGAGTTMTVTIIDPSGTAQAADVIFNPLGEYVGINPRSSP